MKKNYILLALFIAPFLGISQTNILDSDFENPTDLGDWAPGNASTTTITIDATNFFAGTQSMQMENTATWKFAKNSNNTIATAGNFTLTYKIKGPDSRTRAQVVVDGTKYNDKNSTVLMSTLPSETGADGETWYTYSADVDITDIGSTQFEIHTELVGTFYIDNVQLIQNSTLGINDENLVDHETELYPNPAQNVLHVNASNAIKSIEVYNMVGQRVAAQTGTSEINVSNIKQGVYIAKIYFDNGSVTAERFVKK
ncbi:T9SS type A sorting domain-containing protein [Tamlana sp. I1]|uniref:T9SS type A sorting domain-containing protein n=1 Tax=Tamlana sp. I1 TaxID=2762061 RepID=UPI00188FA054|nr:T9SS type A sorting domain-containing protein [Tamlana sp. I1]